MRALAFSAFFSAAAVAFAVPASAQTVTTVLWLINAGSVTTCPATAKFGGAITVTNWPFGPRQVQYKWTFSDTGDQPAESVVASTGESFTVTPTRVDLDNLQKSGSGWVQLTVTFPVNYTSPRINWFLACPPLGSLSTRPTAPSPAR
jgi:hypothetical protein